jgi:hypothetical protein
MSTTEEAMSNIAVLRLEYPQTADEVLEHAEPRPERVDIRDPPGWLRQLVYQHERAKRDFQQFYELNGNRLERHEPRTRVIEQNYDIIYQGLRYLYDQGKKNDSASREWIQTELAHIASAAQCFTQDIWKAMIPLSENAEEHQQARQLQIARNNDVIAFLHAANAERSRETTTGSNELLARPPPRVNPDDGAPGPSNRPPTTDTTGNSADPDFLARLITAFTAAQATVSVVPSPKRANTAKMRMDNPAKFDGKAKTPFRLWWEAVEEYVEFYPETEGKQWISWVGTLLTDEAKAWHHHRRRTLGNADTWIDYQAAIKAHYHDPREAASAHADLGRLRYKGDIRSYFTEFRTLNLIAGATGQGLQEKIDLAMPDEILDMRAVQFKGILSTDEEFLTATEEAGLHVERTKALKATRKELKGPPPSGRTERPPTRGDANKESKSDTRTNPVPSSTTRTFGKRLFASMKDALAGLNLEEINGYRAERAGCFRCGRDGHQAVECYARTSRKGTSLPSIPTVAAVSKRGNEEVQDSAEILPAAKEVATAAAVQTSSNSEVPLWADDSDDSNQDF